MGWAGGAREDGEDGWDGGAAGRHGGALRLRARRGEHQQLLGQSARHLLRAAAWGSLLMLPNSVPLCCSNVFGKLLAASGRLESGVAE